MNDHEGFTLSDADRQTFDGIVVSHLLDIANVDTKRRVRKPRNWPFIGTLATMGAALVFGGSYAAYETTTDDQQSASLSVDVAAVHRSMMLSDEGLAHTATCAKELNVMGDTVAVGLAHNEPWASVYPTPPNYYDAAIRADILGIPCMPASGGSDEYTTNVHGMKVTITGASAVGAGYEVSSMCQSGDQSREQLETHTEVLPASIPEYKHAVDLLQAANQYCPR